ncbi:MAG TPA: hypothetical protein VM243_08220 [Phycisphaerae bacterium]|nr:hypothetical protein [Phycisphaerae bacterium]
MLTHRIQVLVAGIGSVLSGLLVGCQSGPRAGGPMLFFPAPPSRPRVQFLTWASGADQVEPSRGSFEKFILGEEPVIHRAINKPYGVAARDGVVYVCDTKGLCLSRLDFKNQTYSIIGVRGPGRLRKPINVALDSLGYKFVVDPERKQVVVFGPEDKYVTAFDVPEPCHPVDLALHEDELYVLDNDETCQIVVMNRKNGQVLRTFGGPGGEPGQFRIPNSIAVGPDGAVYVSDTHNWRIQKLTAEGVPVWAKGTPGYMLGQFGRPRGIRVGPEGLLYVVDGATEIVQMFDAEGNTLMRFGGPGDMPGALGLPSSLAIDATSIPYFERYIHRDFNVEYLLFVASQYGPHLINVYAFGSFPEGYDLADSQIATLPEIDMDEGIGPVEGLEEAPEEAIESDPDEQEPEGESPG